MNGGTIFFGSIPASFSTMPVNRLNAKAADLTSLIAAGHGAGNNAIELVSGNTLTADLRRDDGGEPPVAQSMETA